jgi:hypothetical protein
MKIIAYLLIVEQFAVLNQEVNRINLTCLPYQSQGIGRVI